MQRLAKVLLYDFKGIRRQRNLDIVSIPSTRSACTSSRIVDTLSTTQNRYIRYNRKTTNYTWSYSLPTIHHGSYNYRSRFRHLSSSSSPSEDSKEKVERKALSLRRLASPFLQLCHPDKFAHIASAQKVNLNAVQTLNELIDTCERISSRTPNKQGESLGNQFMKSNYVIEFMVPSSLSSARTSNGLRRSTENMCTRREVSLSFRNGSWNHIDSSGIATPKQVRDLQRKARDEIRNLIRVAGLHPPKDDIEEDEIVEENDEAYQDMVWEDFSINSNQKQEGKRKARVRWENSQARFRRSINWKERQEKMDRAIRRLEEDQITHNLTSENRKRQIIAEVLSRVRFRNHSYDENMEIDEEDEITPLDQLIALRRISLLFTDHFDKMDIEVHGRTWEKLIIVLNNDPNNNFNMRKKRRRKLGGESGFKFSVRGDDNDRTVTAIVPIDFVDEELLEEFERNLDDLYVVDEDVLNFI